MEKRGRGDNNNNNMHSGVARIHVSIDSVSFRKLTSWTQLGDVGCSSITASLISKIIKPTTTTTAAASAAAISSSIK